METFLDDFGRLGVSFDVAALADLLLPAVEGEADPSTRADVRALAERLLEACLEGDDYRVATDRFIADVYASNPGLGRAPPEGTELYKAIYDVCMALVDTITPEARLERVCAKVAHVIVRKAAYNCGRDTLGEYFDDATNDPFDHPDELLTAIRRALARAYVRSLDGLVELAKESDEERKRREESVWWGTVTSRKRAREE